MYLGYLSVLINIGFVSVSRHYSCRDKLKHNFLVNDDNNIIPSLSHQIFKNHQIPAFLSEKNEINQTVNELVLKTALIFSVTMITSFQQPAFATASLDDIYFSQRYIYNQDPRKVKALKELKELKSLEDTRLALCEDKGKNWEQCFMFGESESSYVQKKVRNDISFRTNHNPIKKNNMPPTW